jgi:hypothetical protein
VFSNSGFKLKVLPVKAGIAELPVVDLDPNSILGVLVLVLYRLLVHTIRGVGFKVVCNISSLSDS